MTFRQNLCAVTEGSGKAVRNTLVSDGDPAVKPMFFAFFAAALSLPGIAAAQSKLLSSSPAADTTVAKPVKLTLRFSDAIVPGMSGVDIVMTGMPGMADHPPMPIKGFATGVAPDGQTLIVTLPRPLPVGSYDLKWHVVGTDRQHVDGGYSFKVR